MAGSYQMYRCAVLSTSTSSLDSVLDRDSLIQILRLTIRTDTEYEYTDGLDLKPDEFYQWQYRYPNHMPNTFPPSYELLRQTFQHLKALGYHSAIVTTLSSKLSETYRRVCQVAAEMADELDIYVFDTGITGMPEGFFALEAMRLLKEGYTPQEVIAKLEQMRPCGEIIFSVHSVNQLVNSGILGKIGAVVVGLLNLMPVLRFHNNTLTKVKTANNSEDVLNATVEAVAARLQGEDLNNLVLCGMYGGNLDLYNRFAAKLHQKTGVHLTGIPISPVVGAYIGPDAVGVGIVKRNGCTG
ncbi:hypothetical protein PL75_05150 [Neisseria arctica]|uniref:DegV family protein n=1 Tax=Neisseria arctica TaxID=1470200 RepID=A0A0J0YSF4_9NEIS|nr:DegV family protein [Neisseria arctica]KLT73056.1 hypothetical protein PL75_05150 [Neisseria arctica]UOO86780.1 DegV family protein [Neisseria arctica]